MSYQELKVKIRGVAPILMHNGRLANPMDPYAKQIKEITRKGTKKMTDADHENIARLEWEGGAYFHGDKLLFIPGENLEATLRDAARKQRRGKDVMAGIMCEDLSLTHPTMKPIDQLWELPEYVDQRGVRVSGRVVRTRLRVPLPWSGVFMLHWDNAVWNKSDVTSLITVAGAGGLCDYHPRYGRFEHQNGKR